MGAKRAFATQDTFITERSLTSNLGSSPILEVYNLFDSAKLRKEFARILIKFNLSALTADIVSGDLVDPRTDTTVSAYLYMFNCKHGDEQATSFNINIHPLTQEWTEGRGLDADNLSETGFANAVTAQSGIAWTTTGGTYVVDSFSATQAFDHGEEDLKVTVTNMFNNWLNGYTGNFGFILKMTDTQELKTGAGSADSIYTKKFYARETNTRKAPYIQLEWDDSIRDDRNSVAFNSTAQLWFFNIVNGQLQDLNTTGAFPGNITLSGLTSATQTTGISAIKTALTAARHSKGIYKCNIGTFPLTANTYSVFKDKWFISASPTANYSFTFTAVDPASAFDEYKSSTYRVTLKNMRNQYEKNTKTRIRIHIKDDSLTYTALTAATTAISNFICTDGKIEIREVDTDDVEIPASKLSYDKSGNFWELDTSLLYSNVQYHPVIKFTIRGETFYLKDPDKYSFKIV